MSYQLITIGTIKTPYKSLNECPFNVDNINGALCELILKDEYAVGLTGLEAGEFIDILYWLDGSVREVSLDTSHGPNADDKLFGTFSLRTPVRPNPIGLARLAIVEIEKGVVKVRGLDCLNGTPLIDIKPSIL
ncbi:tRNA (N6-threonylcarbamoyladenosine(37)-N6)-methyltransferase TrmO [Parendozoicomonas haliclonae]|uniref:S-adenosyl-L-methionine-binding protein n=1 Tax=Parendozoicomonas haliclonae TaxID=1960125 RepID=A0A1X7AIA1_9GAMM|nr:tRNA (N6-threonylcarbamoyladenosine(37)-N6)-methyltransferase TrmO [Parendozoicomonas haliclonae]SMA44395.1 S-adenosyl-L-methionine-binding protein [Parendozoicomonas haliclonae]